MDGRFHGFSGQAPAVGAHLRRRPLLAGTTTPSPHTPATPQRAPLTQPLRGSMRLHRRQSRPIELPELLPLSEQQHGIRATNGGKRIHNRLPHPLAT